MHCEFFVKGTLIHKRSNHTLPHILGNLSLLYTFGILCSRGYKMKAITIFSEVKRKHKPTLSTTVNWYKKGENRGFI